MNAAKSSAPRRGLRHALLQAVTWPLRGAGTVVAALFILVVFFAGGFGYAWRHWGDVVRNHPRYLLTAETLQVTPQPEWIRTDVKSEVIRDGSLDNFNLLEPQVTVKVARAFGIHTWVSNVRRVRKEYPSRIVVELEYRRPVAMVEVVTNGERGLLPVDAKGVLLPPQDFSPEQTRDYLRIAAGNTLPTGPAGTPWGDERIAGAAQVALALSDVWRDFQFYRITAVTATEASRRRGANQAFELSTRAGHRVVWGHAPGQEPATEATAAEKIARLKKYFEQNGDLPSDPGSIELDLRNKAGISVTPRTARKPS
ncbi:MAG TPA: hypothetical protein PLV92_14235 [Pirellulaceae bacterium]|nr:hypothetical protein [Pirellulaceae bacterium]